MRADLRDRAVFEHAPRPRPLRARPPATELLPGLRGKDVLVVFVESYGRVAVQDSWFAPTVDQHADRGSTAQLAGLGFHSRSGWLGSPTFGGHQLAGPLDPAVRPVDRLRAALRPGAGQRPPHPRQRLPPGRLAHRRRHPVRPGPVARGPGLLPLPADATAPATSGTSARATAMPGSPTSTRWPRSTGWSWPASTGGR